MRYLIIGFILILLKITFLSAQDIEIPESIITGQDKNIYRTPIFVYPHEFQIKFPEPPEIPRQYLKIKKPVEQPEKIEKIHEKKFQTFMVSAGKFGYFSSDIDLKYPSFHFSAFATHDDSYRSNDSKDVIELNMKNFCSEKTELNFNLWNCIKEIPFPTIVPFSAQKHTSMLNMKFIYKDQDYKIMIDGTKNSLDKLDEIEGLFGFYKNFEKFFIGTEIGMNKFAKKSNEIFSLSGGYNNDNIHAGITFKKIGEEIRILPLLFFQTEKNKLSFSTTVSGVFSFPQLWKQAGQQPYLIMKNTFLQPEEIYFMTVEISGEKSDVYFSMKGNLSYEKIGYHWQDLDGDNLYEPAILKDNFINAMGLTLGKKFKNFFFESNYSFLNMDKKKTGLPESTAYLKTGFDTKKVKQEFQLVYTGSQIFDKEKIKEYITLSASTFYQIRPNVQLFIQLNNILGKKYQIAPGYPGKPFNFIAGFQTRW